MTGNGQLSELLQRWHEGRELGQPVSVEELCAGCPELAADLRRHIEAGQRLERMADLANSTPDTSAPCEVSPSTQGLAPSKPTHEPARGGLPVVPGYEELSWLGGGGMGTVYRARDVRLGREVALKLVRLEHATPMMLARLQAEARAVAALDHPHIVKVYEVAECQPGDGGPAVPYIALELVSGGSLEQQLKKQRVSPAEAARLVMLLARAMHHAHQKGIVHRDLKPDNVLLAAPADEPSLNTALGCPRVTDFGLARQQSTEARLTQTGAVMGTPAYMAPEQADGRNDVGPAADLYALGAILYRLLAGRVPFQGDSTIDVLYQVRHQPPAPLRQVRPEVPAELEAICLHCLQKKPADRYASAQVLADKLRHWLEEAAAGQCTTTSLPFQEAPAGRPARRRRRLAWAASGAVLLAVAVLAVLGMWGPWRAERAPVGAGSTPEPLTLSLDVRVWKKENTNRGLTLGDDGALPLRAGDFMRIEATASRPAYLYLLYLDAKGEASPCYPWRKYDWNDRPEERRRRQLNEPEDPQKDASPLAPGPSGIEAVLLLGRDEPLSAEENNRLAQMLADKPQKVKFDSLRGAVWLGGADDRFSKADDRGRLNRDQSGQVLDPVERVRRLVRHELPALAVAQCGVCYPFKGQ
jgi:hypothetical protein